MTIFVRRLLARFLVRCLLLLGLTTWLTLAIQLSRRDFTPGEIMALVRALPQALELALVLGAPLVMMNVIHALKRAGILTVYLASGMPIARMRNAVLIAALVVAASSAVLLEATPAGSRWEPEEAGPVLLRTGESLAWHVPALPSRGVPGRTVRFRASDLDVSVESAVSPPPEAVPTSRRTRPLRPPGLSRSLGSPHPVRNLVAALLRISAGGALLLVCAGVALVSNVTRSLLSYLVYVALVLITVFGTVGALILLWSGSLSAYAYLAGFAGIYVAAILMLDRTFRRRAYRVA